MSLKNKKLLFQKSQTNVEFLQILATALLKCHLSIVHHPPLGSISKQLSLKTYICWTEQGMILFVNNFANPCEGCEAEMIGLSPWWWQDDKCDICMTNIGVRTWSHHCYPCQELVISISRQTLFDLVSCQNGIFICSDGLIGYFGDTVKTFFQSCVTAIIEENMVLIWNAVCLILWWIIINPVCGHICQLDPWCHGCHIYICWRAAAPGKLN